MCFSRVSLSRMSTNPFVIAATLVVLKIDGAPVVCKTDEVGEIFMSCGSIGSSYWGLPGLTNAIFRVCDPGIIVDHLFHMIKKNLYLSSQVKPESEDGTLPWPEQDFVRTGLLGFLGPVRRHHI